MKIILLPGMDGTGLLFKPFLSLMSVPYEIISFPSGQNQSYESIYSYIVSRIPDEDFYLVAESFSGPLAARLASENLPNLKGIVFVATFLSCPSKTLVQLVKHLPLKAFLNLPFAPFFVKKYFIVNEFPIDLFYSAMNKVSESELKGRLACLESLQNIPNRAVAQIPALYLCAENDLFVSRSHIGVPEHFRQMLHRLPVSQS